MLGVARLLPTHLLLYQCTQQKNKFKDGDLPMLFFHQLEQAFRLNEILTTQWVKRLPYQLTRSAAAKFHAYIPLSMISDYEACKDKLLTRLGDTITNAERQWHNLSIKSGEDSDSLATRIVLTDKKDAEQLHDCGRNVIVFVLFKYEATCQAGSDSGIGTGTALCVQELSAPASSTRTSIQAAILP